MPRALSLAAASVIVLTPISATGADARRSTTWLAATDPALPSAAAEADDARARAKAEIARAKEAAARGDYTTALDHFERALAIRPSPGLLYNIAVCHHRLMASLPEDDLRRETHRAEAVRSYNAYLRAAPEADDRAEVEAIIVGLGGRPDTLDRWSIDRIEPDGGRPPALRDEPPTEVDATESVDGSRPEPASPTEPAPGPATSAPDVGPAHFPRGTAGFGFSVGIQNMGRIARAEDVASLPFVGGIVRGAGFLGTRRRLSLGGEIGLALQPTATKSRHHLSSVFGGAVIGYRHPLGPQERFELAGGGLVAVVAERLSHRGTTTTSCPVANAKGNEVSSRAGLLLAGRLTFAFLLGARRNHELALRLTPGIALFGPGTTTDATVDGFDCSLDDAPTPWQELDLEGPALVMMVDVGYAPRF